MTQNIEIEGIVGSPLSIPVKPGFVILRGENGTGKTRALDAVHRFLGGAGSVTVEDGHKRGSVAMGDALLTVTRSRAKAGGELEVVAIEDRLDLAKFVDPGIKDQAAADEHRIKCLVTLMGIKADIGPYEKLLGKAFVAALGVDTKTDNALLLNARIKRAIEAIARTAEKRSDELRKDIEVIGKTIPEDIDMDAECDVEVLEDQMRAAVAEHEKLKEKRKHWQDHQISSNDAKKKLAVLVRDYQGPTVTDARQAADELRLQVAALEAELRCKQDELTQKRAEVTSAEAHYSSVRVLEDVLDHEVEKVTAERVEEAAKEESKAMTASAKGRDVAKAKELQSKVKAMEASKRSLDKEASSLRARASQVDTIFTDAIGNPRIRVEAGRLVTATDRSQSEPISELSEGELYDLGIDLAGNQLGDHGMLVLPQEAYASLDPLARKRVEEKLKSKGICALTAICDEGQLRVDAEQQEGQS